MNLPTEGVVLVDKPVGPTSHDVVALIRRETGVQRVGHAGTLDPFAHGLLIILIGRQTTKRQSEFLGMDKTYETTLVFGATSDTDDCTGQLTPVTCDPIPLSLITEQVSTFVGTHDQLPSLYSAKKIGGKKAYALMRAGVIPTLTPKEVTFHTIEILSYNWPELTMRLTVSSGTYIRAFARDLGASLHCPAYLKTLQRTRIGPFLLEDAISINDAFPQ